jgi:hypothetical protein
LDNAWLAILAYHAQILLWRRGRLPRIRMPAQTRDMLTALPAALAGPLLYGLLPLVTRTDLAAWLGDHRLTGTALPAMVPYFGLVHPFLEQVHWGPLRKRTRWAHPAFAGYHLLVLGSLLSTPWLVVCFAVLTAASLLWQRTGTRAGSLAVPVVSHMLADVGIVLAAVALTSCVPHTASRAEAWSYEFASADGSAVLSMDGVAIVFEGEHRSGWASGGLQVSGPGTSGGTLGQGDRAFSQQYADGVNTMQFRRYRFELHDAGTRLRIQGADVDLSGGRKVVVVKANGRVEVRDAASDTTPTAE